MFGFCEEEPAFGNSPDTGGHDGKDSGCACELWHDVGELNQKDGHYEEGRNCYPAQFFCMFAGDLETHFLLQVIFGCVGLIKHPDGANSAEAGGAGEIGFLRCVINRFPITQL